MKAQKNDFTIQNYDDSWSYQNSTWVIGVAKAGSEDGHPLIGGSIIVDPDGNVVAKASVPMNLLCMLVIWMRVILAKAQYLILRDTDVLSITLVFQLRLVL